MHGTIERNFVKKRDALPWPQALVLFGVGLTIGWSGFVLWAVVQLILKVW
jgi:hypothetical protein